MFQFFMLWYEQTNHEAQNIRVIKNMSITIFYLRWKREKHSSSKNGTTVYSRI